MLLPIVHGHASQLQWTLFQLRLPRLTPTAQHGTQKVPWTSVVPYHGGSRLPCASCARRAPTFGSTHSSSPRRPADLLGLGIPTWKWKILTPLLCKNGVPGGGELSAKRQY